MLSNCLALAQRLLLLTINLTLALPDCIAAAEGFPRLQLGHFRFKRHPKWQINFFMTLSRAPRFNSSSDEAETNSPLSDREEVMMFQFHIEPCTMELAGLEGRSGSISFNLGSAGYTTGYLERKMKTL